MPTERGGFSYPAETTTMDNLNELKAGKPQEVPDSRLADLAKASHNSDANVRDISSQRNIKKYIGCKIILAEPMSQDDFLKYQGKYIDGAETLGEGYKVAYPDGYVSWSPKKVFEEAYREISIPEMGLINGY